MKTIFALAAVCGYAFAQYDTYSNPFRLFLKSDNSTLNGTALGACHQGAAIEGLCVTGETRDDNVTSYTTFYHAYNTFTSNSSDDNLGILYWDLQYNGNLTQPSAMRFITDVTSNVLLPLFFPGNETVTYISFAECGDAYISRYSDDTVSPPASLPEEQHLQNWYVCLTRYGYLYETLTWKIGVTGEPQNPSCLKVQVQREYI